MHVFVSGRQRTPYNDLLFVYMKKMDHLCTSSGNVPTPFDKAMSDLLVNLE